MALFFYFNQRPLSLYCVWNRWTYQEVRLHSPFWKMVEDEYPISPVRTLVHFYILFFIIKASTANQGKRKHLSFLSSVFIWQLIKAIFFLLISHFLWYECDCLSVYFSTINLIKRHCSSHLCCAVLWSANGSTGLQ